MNRGLFFGLFFVVDFLIPFVPLGSLLLLIAALNVDTNRWLVNKLQGE
jgi:hypothetical protein